MYLVGMSKIIGKCVNRGACIYLFSFFFQVYMQRKENKTGEAGLNKEAGARLGWEIHRNRRKIVWVEVVVVVVRGKGPAGEPLPSRLWPLQMVWLPKCHFLLFPCHTIPFWPAFPPAVRLSQLLSYFHILKYWSNTQFGKKNMFNSLWTCIANN